MISNAHSFSSFAGFFVLNLIAGQVAFATCEGVKTPAAYRFPVVLSVPQVLTGVPVDAFSAWSLKGKVWQKVALQVDQINAEGNYVLEYGIPYTKNTDDGIADANDEISLRGTSLGDHFSLDKVTPAIRNSLKRFVRLDVCIGDEDQFAGSILVGWSKELDRAATWNNLFEVSSKSVVTPAYRYLFNSERPMVLGQVYLKSGGKEFPVFEKSTFVVPVVPRLWILPGFKFGQEDFKSEIECWRQGPVRSIVAVGAKLKKFFSIMQLHLFSELVFYDDYFQIPTQIEMVFDADRFLDYGSGFAYILRFPVGVPWQLSTVLPELPLSPDLNEGSGGSLKVTAKQFSPEGVFRAWGSRPEGSFLAQIRVDKKAINNVPPPFVIHESSFADPERKKNWSWLKGNQGNLGVFLDISRIHKGIYDFALDLMLSPRANDGFTDFRSAQGEWTILSRE